MLGGMQMTRIKTRAGVAVAAVGALLLVPGVPAAANTLSAERPAHVDAVVIDLGNRVTATVDPASGQVRMTTPTPLSTGRVTRCVEGICDVVYPVS